MRSRRSTMWLLAVVLAAGCASGSRTPAASPASPPAASAPAAAAKPAQLPESIRWMQNSAEYVAIATQTYRVATARVEADARGRTAGTWTVVLDADDTVINNIQYQAGLFRDGVTHTPERFTAWVRQRASTAVPGAKAFLTRVHELGGRIAIVTNRLQIECDDTAEMLRHAVAALRCDDLPAGGRAHQRAERRRGFARLPRGRPRRAARRSRSCCTSVTTSRISPTAARRCARRARPLSATSASTGSCCRIRCTAAGNRKSQKSKVRSQR